MARQRAFRRRSILAPCSIRAGKWTWQTCSERRQSGFRCWKPMSPESDIPSPGSGCESAPATPPMTLPSALSCRPCGLSCLEGQSCTIPSTKLPPKIDAAGRDRRFWSAELARAGLTPDWMPGAVPRCVPVEIRRNQHGERTRTEVVGIERVQYRGRRRTVEVLACPVMWRPHPEQITGARRSYEDWWRPLGWAREGLMAAGCCVR